MNVLKSIHLGEFHYYYLEKDGRLGLYQFWQGCLPILALILVFNVLSTYLPGELFAVLFLATIYPTFALLIKRAHDIGMSGNYCWLLLIPIVNAYVFLTLAILPGTQGDNQFGVDPQAHDQHLLWG